MIDVFVVRLFILSASLFLSDVMSDYAVKAKTLELKKYRVLFGVLGLVFFGLWGYNVIEIVYMYARAKSRMSVF